MRREISQSLLFSRRLRANVLNHAAMSRGHSVFPTTRRAPASGLELYWRFDANSSWPSTVNFAAALRGRQHRLLCRRSIRRGNPWSTLTTRRSVQSSQSCRPTGKLVIGGSAPGAASAEDPPSPSPIRRRGRSSTSAIADAPPAPKKRRKSEPGWRCINASRSDLGSETREQDETEKEEAAKKLSDRGPTYGPKKQKNGPRRQGMSPKGAKSQEIGLKTQCHKTVVEGRSRLLIDEAQRQSTSLPRLRPMTGKMPRSAARASAPWFAPREHPDGFND